MNKKIELQLKITEAHLQFHKNEEAFLELIKKLVGQQTQILANNLSEKSISMILNSFNNTMGLLERNQIMYNKSHDRFLRMNLISEEEDNDDSYPQKLLKEGSANQISEKSKIDSNTTKDSQSINNLPTSNTATTTALNTSSYTSTDNVSSNNILAVSSHIEGNHTARTYSNSNYTKNPPLEKPSNSNIPTPPINAVDKTIAIPASISTARKQDNTTLSVDKQHVITTVIKTIIEFTGYPESIISEEMDLKNDLGFDNQKLRELFSVLQKKDLQIKDKYLQTMHMKINSISDLVEIIMAGKKSTSPIHCFTIKPHPLDNVLNNISTSSHPGTVLIIDDTKGFSSYLAHELNKINIKAIILTWPKHMYENSIKKLNRIKYYDDLLDINDKNLGNKYKILINEEIISEIVLIHSCCLNKTNIESIFSNLEITKLKTCQYLINYFSSFTTNNFFNVFSIYRLNGKFGIDTSNPFSITPMGLPSIIDAMSKDLPIINPKFIDINRLLSDEDAAKIATCELLSLEKESFVGVVDKSKRYTFKLFPVEKRTNDFYPPNRRTVFLVSGITNKFSFKIIEKISNIYKSNFIILGNKEIHQSEPKWAKNITEESQLKYNALNYYRSKFLKINLAEIDKVISSLIESREIIKKIKSLEKNGSSVIYINTNSNMVQLRNAIKFGEERIGKITGLIYKSLYIKPQRKTNNLYNQIEKNILELKNILSNFDINKLEHLYLISLGDNESLATGIFDKAAYSLSSYMQSTKVLSILFKLSSDQTTNINNTDETTDAQNNELDIFSNILNGSYGNNIHYIIKE